MACYDQDTCAVWGWFKVNAVEVGVIVAILAAVAMFWVDIWHTKNAFKVRNVWRKRRKKRKPKRSRRYLRTNRAKRSSTLAI